MSIIKFPSRSSKNTKKRKLILNSNEKAYVNHQYIREFMNENGYKRENDVLIQKLNQLIVKFTK
ncbi:hypothetical protein PB1_10664 [Bacillus methanolicus PB1]|uniref:Uncharacterized protein n=1 Tax=Bacillus methanolicus PB1 TaxID=997296 RepID=I3DUV0_BACMT|nr:hypothetical protein PB1_10664 [Bacillus methanolicus PB1]